MTDETAQTAPYRVLARKYRPADFADLVGQEALVRTLTNAITSGRLAHAFVLTGVRGVGKTTTARIIARALNCIGADGSLEGPTPEPCGKCENCTAIAEDRHVDVIEMDAASRTGIDDIRELIEGVRYRPVSARTKVYIIDEVHMLSRQAFNGLLKTLEEPPEHVIFVFATTEIRKVPVTVLSRCQRFDLRRVDQAVLIAHFKRIAETEGVAIEDAALAMIARAADGSVRDGLSLLDQAIALCGESVAESQVRDMLGLADRSRTTDLFEAVMAGEARTALDIFADLYKAGAEPTVVLQDLLDLAHFLTRTKLVPETGKDPTIAESERLRGKTLADKLSMPVLGRSWQLLLKGLGETQAASAPRQAAEMVLIRLCYASGLPTPGDLVKKLQDGTAATVSAVAAGGTAPAPGDGARAQETMAPAAEPTPDAGPAQVPDPIPDAGPLPGHGGGLTAQAVRIEPTPEPEAEAVPGAVPEAVEEAVPEAVEEAVPGAVEEPAAPPAPEPRVAASPDSFVALVALARQRREGVLAHILESDVHLVRFEAGRLEIRTRQGAPKDLAGRLGRLLESWTEQRWMVSVSSEPGEPTLKEQKEAAAARWRASVMADPLVKAVVEVFPEARLKDDAGPTPRGVAPRSPSEGPGNNANADDGRGPTDEAGEASRGGPDWQERGDESR